MMSFQLKGNALAEYEAPFFYSYVFETKGSVLTNFSFDVFQLNIFHLPVNIMIPYSKIIKFDKFHRYQKD